MVKAQDEFPHFQQPSAWHSPNLNHMSTLLQPGQQNGLASCTNPCTFSKNVAFPGVSVSCLPGGAHRLHQCFPPHLESSLPTLNPYLKASHCVFPYRIGVKATPNDVAGSTQKRFLLFDKSGNQTRLFFTPFSSPSQNTNTESIAPVCACDLHGRRQIGIMEQTSLPKLVIQEKSNENHIVGQGSEMHEDTEEINALLYSDDDDEADDDVTGEDDEVMSTGHSPFATGGIFTKHEQVEEITEEVDSSDGSTKRQRLLDGGYKKSSLVDTANFTKPEGSCKYADDVESNCANGRIQGEDMGSILDDKWLRKDKIHETLRILEIIIPDIKSKDPLLIIDDAINYLKSLKHKAKALGVTDP